MGYWLHKPGIVRAVRRRRRGFTLLELLVVVGIIAALLALLLPALNRARRQARSVACLANLHQLGIAFQSYFQQNRGRPPCLYGNLDTTEQVWVPLLRREMNGSHKALLCPDAAEPTGVPQYDWGSWEIGTAHHAWIWQVTTVAVGSGVPWAWDGGSYGMNAWLLTIPPDVEVPPQSPRDAYITTPARDSDRIPLLADAVYHEATPRHTDGPPASLSVPIPLRAPWPSDPGANGMWQFCIARHGRAVNVLFLDGHARTVPLEELWKLKWSNAFVPTNVTLAGE